ncbi:MAG: DR2241 family protein [Limisphaerales bacterium]
MNPDLSAFVAALSEETVFGQVLVRRANRGFALRHVADRQAAEETCPLVKIEDLRQLAQFTELGVYRPLKAAPNLRRGWRATAVDAPALGLCLHYLYPGALPDWFASQGGQPPVTSYRDFASRQTGMYRITALLNDPVATAVARACCHRDFCLKRRLWTVGQLAPDEPAEKSIIPCLEPCAILLELARKASRWEQETAAQPAPAPAELERLSQECAGQLKHPEPGLPECDFDSPNNPRRLRFFLERKRVAPGEGFC